MATAKQLGKFIAAHRRERGLTLAAVASEVGVAKSVVHDWEQGRMRPKPPNLEGLASALEVDLERLYEVAGYAVPRAVPELGEYLRTKFPELPARVIKRMERVLNEIATKEGAGA